MTAKQYRAALKALELSQRGAARLFKAGERTSRAWALGEREVPEAIAILLRLMVAGKVTADDVEKAR